MDEIPVDVRQAGARVDDDGEEGEDHDEQNARRVGEAEDDVEDRRDRHLGQHLQRDDVRHQDLVEDRGQGDHQRDQEPDSDPDDEAEKRLVERHQRLTDPVDPSGEIDLSDRRRGREKERGHLEDPADQLPEGDADDEREDGKAVAGQPWPATPPDRGAGHVYGRSTNWFVYRVVGSKSFLILKRVFSSGSVLAMTAASYQPSCAGFIVFAFSGSNPYCSLTATFHSASV